MEKKRVTYIGLDNAFCDELNELCQKYVVGDHVFSALRLKGQNLAEHCFKIRQNIVFVDLSLLKPGEISSIVEQVGFIKQQPALKGTLFALIFENTQSFKKHEWLVSKGFHITFTVGQDLVNFFMDCYRIAINDDYALPQFAKATNMNTKLEMSYCSSLLALSKKYALVETDFKQKEDQQLKVQFPCFPDLNKVELNIKLHHEHGLCGLGLDTYLLEMPVPDPWEEISQDTLAEETIETWLENHQDDFIQRAPFIYLFNLAGPENIKKAYHTGLETQLNFLFENNYFSAEDLQEGFKVRQPPLIFIEIFEREITPGPDEIEEEKLYEADFSPLEQIIRAISMQVDYHPIIVLGSCPSSSEAMRKSFRYNSILANTQTLNWEMVEQLALKFKEKKTDRFHIHDLEFLSLTRHVSYMETCIDTIVTSLSEHEITFYAPEGLPMYGVLKTLLPVEAYITIIPPIVDLEKKEGLEHYMGILHGINETQLNILRQVVNRLIHEPLDEFTVGSFQTAEIAEEKIQESPSAERNHKQHADHSNKNKKHVKIDDTYARPVQHSRTKL